MKAHHYFAGLLALIPVAPIFGFQDFKVPYNCTQDDIQWAGMTCPDNDPCPVYLELSSVSSAGSRLFLAGNIHSSQITLYSVLLRSDDGGATWQDAHERERGEELDHIQFQNLETGWVSGQRAVPLPGDAFFLITHDGGKSWRKVLVLPEGSPGFIQKFRFDSATSGKMTIDRGASEGDEPRYRLYESMDGGDSWAAVEASDKPITNAPAPVDDSVWRLRPDKNGKTVSVERKTADNQWAAAVRFSIQIGSCREQ